MISRRRHRVKMSQRNYLYSCTFESASHYACDTTGVGRVTMDAKALHGKLQILPFHSPYGLSLNHPERSFGRKSGIFDNRIRPASRNQQTISAVISVNEALPEEGDFQFYGFHDHGRTGWRQNVQAVPAGGFCYGFRVILSPPCHIVEGSVRLEMIQTHPRLAREHFQVPDLAIQLLLKILPSYFKFSPSKSSPVPEGGVGTHPRTGLFATRKRFQYKLVRAGMCSTGNVGRSNIFHEAYVTTELLNGGCFAHIR